MTKLELTIKDTHVRSWGFVEAIRELFQNAYDNQVENPENEMFFSYHEGVMRIGNKTSKLETDSLLIGSSTKADNKDTIGQHGEGYKLAILILLRQNKTITFYNYGKREVWTTRLKKSKRFNYQLIPEITINRKYIWQKVPSHDLIIEITGVTDEEYAQAKDKNLHLKYGDKPSSPVPLLGELLTTEEEKGRFYVGGLYVTTLSGFQYGYNLHPSVADLDRDRRMLSSFDASMHTSNLWYSLGNDEELVRLLDKGAIDVNYVNKATLMRNSNTVRQREIASSVSRSFKEKHGDRAIPVVDNTQLEVLKSHGLADRATFVPHTTAPFLSEIYEESLSRLEVAISTKDRLKLWFAKIPYVESHLTEEFNQILEELD